jgi:hypothetical protein
MHRFRFYRMLLLAMVLLAFVALNFLLVGKMIYREYKVERGFRQQYGEDWKDRYDQRYGPGSLQRAQARTIAGYAGMPVISLLLWLIYRQATVDRSGGTQPSRKRFRPNRQKNKW